jgi:hypothetical protein
VRRVVVDGGGDAGVERDVLAQVEAVHDVVEVALHFRLAGEVLAPVPVGEQLLGEDVPVGVALGVEPRLRVAVPVPDAADTPARLEQPDVEARLAGPVELVDPDDARADDQDLGSAGDRRGRALVVVVVIGSGWCHSHFLRALFTGLRNAASGARRPR